MAAARGQKLLDKCGRLLRDCNLIEDESESVTATLPELVRALIATTEPGHYEFNETQCDAWARCISDLTLDRSIAVEALRLGILPALPRFLKRYKSSHEAAAMTADISWSDTLIGLHNFALLEEKGFPEALAKLSAADMSAIALNLARALKPGLYPSDARDAASRLCNYDIMTGPLIESGVLLSLALFIPTVKPFNRLPQALWGPEALREINHTLQVGRGGWDGTRAATAKRDRTPYRYLSLAFMQPLCMAAPTLPPHSLTLRHPPGHGDAHVHLHQVWARGRASRQGAVQRAADRLGVRRAAWRRRHRPRPQGGDRGVTRLRPRLSHQPAHQRAGRSVWHIHLGALGTSGLTAASVAAPKPVVDWSHKGALCPAVPLYCLQLISCVQICRLAVPSNRSMLFRVASAITSTSSTALLSAAAQVWGVPGSRL